MCVLHVILLHLSIVLYVHLHVCTMYMYTYIVRMCTLYLYWCYPSYSTEEEISAMKLALEKYGISLPSFGKIGGILANEVVYT